MKGDSARARVYADSGLAAYEELIRANPRNDQAYALVGLTLAYLGRYDEAVASTRRAIALHGTDQDKYAGAYNELQLARVYAMAGRREQAMTELEQLLRTPSFLTPGWLRIDPTFASLRGNPRFERLVRGPCRRRICARDCRRCLPLLDSGEATGLLYEMPYMDGESLRARLARQADLPVPEAIKLMTEVCDALAHAHERGIVHRDIRPDEEQQRVGVPVPPADAAGRGAPLAAQRRFELSEYCRPHPTSAAAG